jgi:ubiquinone biosynthesis protein
MKLTSIPQFARNANRMRQIGTILAKYGFADWVARLNLGFAKGLFREKDGQRLADLTHETRIRLVLTELGTTFIKLGQMLSTRPDLIGPELAKELTSLQDQARADSPEIIKHAIEKELGKPVTELFAEFDDQPLASASIGQVHRARLQDGTQVVVKVQHPDIEKAIRNDLEILIALAELAEKYLEEARPYRPQALALEFQHVLLRELDFMRELRNLEQFGSNFSGDERVHFPKAFPELSTSRVLTMEMLQGTRLVDVSLTSSETGGRVALCDREELAKRGAQVFLEMIFRDGFYHADPHPGNILVLDSCVIGLLDCGMVGRIDENLRNEIEDMLMAISHRDALHLTSIITRIGSVPPTIDQSAFIVDIADYLAYYGGLGLDQLDLGGALNELTQIIRRYHIVLPSGVALLIKVLVMLEGTSQLLNPHFNLTELIQPYQGKLMWRRLSPTRYVLKFWRLFREWEYLAELLPRGLTDILQQVQSGRFEVHLEHKSLEPSVNRLVLGMLTAALFLGSALLWSMKVELWGWDFSLLGVIGCILSFTLGLRLLWAIRKSGKLER